MSDLLIQNSNRFARNIEKIQEDARQQVITTLRQLLLPMIQNLIQEENSAHNKFELIQIHNYIEDIISDFATRLQVLASLSNRELHIALMIKNGATNEDIADYLDLAPQTVKTHRRNIRKKLGLTHSHHRLKGYLQYLASRLTANSFSMPESDSEIIH